VLFTEDGAWDLTYRGAQPLDPQRYQTFKDTTQRNIFYILRCRMNEPGLDFYWRSSDIFDNRPVEIVEITDAANQMVTVFFDQDAKLPCARSSAAATSSSRISIRRSPRSPITTTPATACSGPPTFARTQRRQDLRDVLGFRGGRQEPHRRSVQHPASMKILPRSRAPVRLRPSIGLFHPAASVMIGTKETR